MKITHIIFIIAVALNLSLGAAACHFYQQNYNTSAKIEDEKRKAEILKTEFNDLKEKYGTLESELVGEKKANKITREELAKLDKELKDKVKRYDLDLKSRDKTIAELKGKVDGGVTEVVIYKTDPKDGKCDSCPTKISYSWKDKLGRFQLKDPNIFEDGNESFSYLITLSYDGVVFSDKDGGIQIRKLDIYEVVPKSISGKTVYEKLGKKLKVVDGKFEFIKEDSDLKSIFDIFNPRVFAFYDTQLNPGVGIELLNFGNYFDFINFGINANAGFNLSKNFTKINESTLGLGVSYTFIKPFLDTNIGIGVSLNTPYNNFANRLILTGQILFYLSN